MNSSSNFNIATSNFYGELANKQISYEHDL